MKRRSALFALAMIVGVGFIGSATFVVQRASLLQTDSRNKAFELADTDGDGTLSVREIRKAVTQSIMASTSPNAKRMYDFDDSGAVNRQDVKNIVSAFKSILETPPVLPASSAKDTTMPLVEYAFIRETTVQNVSSYELVILSYNLIGEFNGRANHAFKLTSSTYEKTFRLEDELAAEMPKPGLAHAFALPNFHPSADTPTTLTLLDIHPITHEETTVATMSLRVITADEEYASETQWKPTECHQTGNGLVCTQEGASLATLSVPTKSMGEEYVATVRVKYAGEFKDYEVPLAFQSTQALSFGIQPSGAYIQDNDCSFTEANTHFTLTRQAAGTSEYLIGVAFDGIAKVSPVSTLHNQEYCMAAYAGLMNLPAASNDGLDAETFASNRVDVAIVGITKRQIAGYVASKAPENIVLASKVLNEGGNAIQYTDLNVTFPELQYPDGKRSFVLMDIYGTQRKMGFLNGVTITDFATFENLLPSRRSEAGTETSYARIIITEPLAPDAVGVNGNAIFDAFGNSPNDPIVENLLPEQIRYARTITFAEVQATAVMQE